MRKIDTFVLHCSASDFGDAALIDKWHKERTPPFRENGYNYVILNGILVPNGAVNPSLDGAIQSGRNLNNDTWIEENEVGAHALGFNDHSIGVCWIGGQGGSKKAFTVKQYWSGLLLAAMWRKVIPGMKFLGHNETGAQKACPVISMDLFRDRLARMNKDMSFEVLKAEIAIQGV